MPLRRLEIYDSGYAFKIRWTSRLVATPLYLLIAAVVIALSLPARMVGWAFCRAGLERVDTAIRAALVWFGVECRLARWCVRIADEAEEIRRSIIPPSRL